MGSEHGVIHHRVMNHNSVELEIRVVEYMGISFLRKVPNIRQLVRTVAQCGRETPRPARRESGGF
jgi:hypothetical protein